MGAGSTSPAVRPDKKALGNALQSHGGNFLPFLFTSCSMCLFEIPPGDLIDCCDAVFSCILASHLPPNIIKLRLCHRCGYVATNRMTFDCLSKEKPTTIRKVDYRALARTGINLLLI